MKPSKAKVAFKDIVKIVPTPATFADFQAKLVNAFKEILPSNYKITYTDTSEPDSFITVSSQEDYELAFSQNIPNLKFTIIEKSAPLPDNKMPCSLQSAEVSQSQVIQPIPPPPPPAFEVAAPLYPPPPSKTAPCFFCQGLKRVDNGSKVCLKCKGTGVLPIDVLEALKSVIASELKYQ